MQGKRKIVIGASAVLLAGGIAAGSAVAASADTYPTPTTPVPIAVQTVPPPVVNPFRNCAFSVTETRTFDPGIGRFVNRFEPAIVCNTRFGVRVYDLLR